MVSVNIKDWGFEGWSFGELLRHNASTIRLILAFLVGYSYMTGFSWETFLAGVGVLAGKLLLDTFDYFVSK